MNSMPIGSVSVRTTTVRNQPRQERRIKVSHHGNWRQRWRPFARHWWETEVGPIPDGYQVKHRDGDSLNDDPGNLVLVREQHFAMLFARNPKLELKRRKRQATAARKSNRTRGAISRAQIKPDCWYIALPLSRSMVWIPCESRAQLLMITSETLSLVCRQNLEAIEKNGGIPYEYGHPVQCYRGEEIPRHQRIDGILEGFLRLIPDTRRAPRKRSRPEPDQQFCS